MVREQSQDGRGGRKTNLLVSMLHPYISNCIRIFDIPYVYFINTYIIPRRAVLAVARAHKPQGVTKSRAWIAILEAKRGSDNRNPLRVTQATSWICVHFGQGN